MLLRMSQAAYQIAHYGEYNFCRRLVERADQIPMLVALGHFTQAVLRMYFYLDGDFAPYWKWLTFEFRRRGFCTGAAEALETLHQKSPREQSKEIISVCERLRERMIDRDVVPSDMDSPHGGSRFFVFARHLRGKIVDDTIRAI